MTVYTITPQPFGEDAVAKEVRFLVATSKAAGTRVFAIDLRPCSAYLRTAARHSLSALKRDGRVAFFVPGERFTPEDTGAAFLTARDPALLREPLLRERTEGIFVVSL